MAASMAGRGKTPNAKVLERVDTILAQGAAFADLTHLGEPTTLIRTGDALHKADAGRLTILNCGV
jgi:predicted aconitase with swiveling domain